MFGIIKGLAKIALSPINGLAEVVKDVSGQNGEDSQIFGLMTLGITSVVKGTAKGIQKGTEDIFED